MAGLTWHAGASHLVHAPLHLRRLSPAPARRSGVAGADRSFELVRGEAVGVAEGEAGPTVTLADGSSLDAAAVVLATGVLSPGDPPLADGGWPHDSPLYAPDPWADGALERLAPGDDLLLVGSGLTMVDIALRLIDLRPEARLEAVLAPGSCPRRTGGRASAIRSRTSASPRPAPRCASCGPPPTRPAPRPTPRAATGATRSTPCAHTRRTSGKGSRSTSSAGFCAPIGGTGTSTPPHGTRGRRLDRLAAGGRPAAHGRRPHRAGGRGGRPPAGFDPPPRRDAGQREFAPAVNCTGPAGSVVGAGSPLYDSLLSAGLARPTRSAWDWTPPRPERCTTNRATSPRPSLRSAGCAVASSGNRSRSPRSAHRPPISPSGSPFAHVRRPRRRLHPESLTSDGRLKMGRPALGSRRRHYYHAARDLLACIAGDGRSRDRASLA